jgi:hypothetical protein
VQTFHGTGRILNELIGPGATAHSELLYRSHVYSSFFEILGIDLFSGAYRAYRSPIRSENAAWALVRGPDGNVYVGTAPNAHLLRLDPRTGVFADLGQVATGEHYIWQLTVGADGRIYGCTYPSAKIVRFDPRLGRIEDLGRMDPTEQYARTIAASRDGFIYVGIGTRKASIVAYEIATGRHREILALQYQRPGTAGVFAQPGGQVIGQVPGSIFSISGWDASEIPHRAFAKNPELRLVDGGLVRSDEHGDVIVADPRTGEDRRVVVVYPGAELKVFRLAVGPDGIYGSTASPSYLFRLDPFSYDLQVVSELGRGHAYSLLAYGDSLLGAIYGGRGPLFSYTPTRKFGGLGGRTEFIGYPSEQRSWRPAALVAGTGGRVFIGATAEYGSLDGHLVTWDVAHRVISATRPIKNQSVVSLASTGGLIIGGTSVVGGRGIRPSEAEAKLFVWRPETKEKVYEIIPISGERTISSLAVMKGLAYGVTDHFAFEFDPIRHRIAKRQPLPCREPIYNTLTPWGKDLLLGLCADGIFSIDTHKGDVHLIARSPVLITAGTARYGRFLYFASDSRIYRYCLEAACKGDGPLAPGNRQ